MFVLIDICPPVLIILRLRFGAMTEDFFKNNQHVQLVVSCSNVMHTGKSKSSGGQNNIHLNIWLNSIPQLVKLDQQTEDKLNSIHQCIPPECPNATHA
jgi:hypothetical protein